MISQKNELSPSQPEDENLYHEILGDPFPPRERGVMSHTDKETPNLSTFFADFGFLMK